MLLSLILCMHYSYYNIILLRSRDVNYYCYVMIIVGHVSELKKSLLVNPPESAHTCKKNKLYMVPPVRPTFLSILERKRKRHGGVVSSTATREIHV